MKYFSATVCFKHVHSILIFGFAAAIVHSKVAVSPSKIVYGLVVGDVTSGLYKIANVYTIDFMCWLGVLLAIQNTSCPLSVLTTRLRSCDVVFTEPFNATLVYVD